MNLEVAPAGKMEGMVDFVREGQDLVIVELVGRLRMVSTKIEEYPTLISVGEGKMSGFAYRMRPNTEGYMAFERTKNPYLTTAELDFSESTLVEWDGRVVRLNGEPHKDFGPLEDVVRIEREPVPPDDSGLPL